MAGHSPTLQDYGSPDEMDCGDYEVHVHSTGADMMTEDKKFKMKPQKDKTCLVCGDKALGYNFNAVSCESCKAFFRRNAFKEIRGRCEGKCEVTVESRSYCKRCRLQKCFAVGMKRDLILNDQQRMQRRQKIQENRMRRSGVSPMHSDYGSMGMMTELPPLGHRTSSTNSSSTSPMSATCGSASGSAASSPQSLPLNSAPGVTGSGLSPPDDAHGVKQEVGDEDEEPGAAPHVLASTVDIHNFDGMPDHVVTKTREVIKAFSMSFDSPMDRNPVQAPSGEDFLNMADASVRRLVKMAKHLSLFRQLEQADQIALLKGAVVEVLILRSAKMFDGARKGWSVNKGGSESQVSAAALQYGNNASMSFFKQYQRFATCLLQSTRKDNTILMLLIILTIFSPDRAQPNSREKVMMAQECYAEVLRVYINHKYSGGDLMLPKILQKLADIRELNETHTQMLMHMKVDELEPLIVEIFDLSS